MQTAESRLPPAVAYLAIGTGFLLLAGLTAAYFMRVAPVDVGQAVTQSGSALDDYRRRGMPWEARDLRRSVDPNENAADLVRKTGRHFLSGGTYYRNRYDATNFLDNNYLDLAEKCIASESAGLALAYKASLKSDLYFNTDYDYGLAYRTPDWIGMHRAIDSLLLRAELRAKQGRDDEMLKDVATAARLAALVSKDPSILALSYRVNSERAILASIVRCAGSASARPKTLARLSDQLKRMDQPIDVRRAFAVSAYTGIATLRNLKIWERHLRQPNKHGIPMIIPSSLERTGMPSETVHRAYMTRYLQIWADSAEIMARHENDVVAMGKELGELWQQSKKNKSPSNDLVRLMDSGLKRLCDNVGEVYAGRAATLALLSALEQRATKGAIPAELEQLPGTYVDPFTKKPLMFRKSFDSVRIYSVGPDGVDNGGTHRVETSYGAQGWDVVASFPPLPRTPAFRYWR